jgi:DNA transformation protein and related proteins
MSEPVSVIKNIGPKSVPLFARAGIHSAQQLRDMGPDEAYRKLVASGTRPHFIGYYALVMGMQGRLWNDCKGAEKTALRERFDALVGGSHDKGLSELEAELNKIGVVKPSK